MLFLLLALFVVFWGYHGWYKRRNLPPGPFPWPIVGNVFEFWNTKRWEYKFMEWREKYGNVYTYYIGTEPIITVNDYETSYRLFVKDGQTFEDRAATEALDYATRGGINGIIESSGSLWRENRRLALRIMRDFGLGKNRMSERIMDEIDTLFFNVDKELDAGAGEMDFHSHTDIATGSVINSVVNGFRFTTNGREEEFYMLKHTLNKIVKGFSSVRVNLASVFPKFARLPFFRGPFQDLVDEWNKINKYLANIIDEHEAQNDYTEEEFEPRDFLDGYLKEMKQCEKQGDLKYFSKLQLQNISFDLWFAGQETTSTTLTWSIAFLIRHPEAQKQMQAELDRVVGQGQLVTLAHKMQLPYTNATIMECQRCANILPQNVPRKTTRDVDINGYNVPKGTIILSQISVLLIDPNVYDKPREFIPKRFIDEKGQLKKAEEFIPFSLGKRQCLGEALARMEMFLFIANLFHKYEFTPGKVPPSLEKANTGFSMHTEPYKCRVNRRF